MAESKLKYEIVEVLRLAKNDNCLSKTGLQSKVRKNMKCQTDKFEKALKELCDENRVRKKNENEYCLDLGTRTNGIRRVFPGPPIIPRHQIAEFLSQATEPVATEELAQTLDLSTRQVYGICRRFENKGYLKGEVKRSEKRVFFAPLTGEVLHAGNYERVSSLYKELSSIVADFSPGDTKTEQNLQGFFTDMVKKKEYAKHRKSINTFRKGLLRTVTEAGKKSDVDKVLGLRPFHPKVRTCDVKGSPIKGRVKRKNTPSCKKISFFAWR